MSDKQIRNKICKLTVIILCLLAIVLIATNLLINLYFIRSFDDNNDQLPVYVSLQKEVKNSQINPQPINQMTSMNTSSISNMNVNANEQNNPNQNTRPFINQQSIIIQKPATPIQATLPDLQPSSVTQQIQQKIAKIKQQQNEMLNKFPGIIKIVSHNLQASNTNFGQGKQFMVKLSSVPKLFNNFDGDQHDEVTPIQVASPLDFTTISTIVDFKQLDKKLTQSITHQVISFEYNQKLEKKKQYIAYSTKKIEKEIKNAVLRMNQYQEYGFGVQLSKYKQDLKLKQKQYEYYNKKYNIGSMKEQSPICMYAAGYKLFSKNRYKLFFESVQRQNYTNFQIVYVDDNSPDQSAYHIFEYLSKTNTRINNRISIVHNLQHIGAMANMYFWVRKYCKQDSIVIIVDGDDSIIGNQVFQVLNAVYKKQSNWYVYSNYISYYPQNGRYFGGDASSNFVGSTTNYRTLQGIWTTSHIRTFRKKLMDAVPIEHFIQYHYNSTTQLAWPRFYGSSADRFQVYTQLQLAGDDRVVHITDPLYLYDATVGVVTNKCYRQHQGYDEYKSRTKTPLKRLQSFDHPPQYRQDYNISQSILNNLGLKYHEYQICRQQYIQ